MKFLIITPKGIVEPIQDLIDNANKITYCPNPVIYTSVYASYSAIIQFFTDLIIETASLLGFFIKAPFRPDFLFLASLSALLSYQTLNGLRKLKIDLTQEAIQVALLIESALIISDLYFIFSYPDMTMELLVIRCIFLFLTIINLVIFTYITLTLKLFKFNIFKQIFNFFYAPRLKPIFKKSKENPISDTQSE